ncbi:MAG: outer membrane protein assembly factor BamA [Alphaproteobacteria bacterium]|nr:outer membrane protein assembly factor BamA [Alphaproteobacteria bacterium]
MKKLLVSCCFLSLFSELSADVVKKIVFKGLDRVEKEVVEDCVTIKPGKEYNEQDIDATIKAIFAKGFFSDVKISKVGDVLVIKCIEKQMIDQVAFEGNSASSDDTLKNVVNNRLSSGRLFSTYVVKDVVSDMQMMYRALGYCSAVVVPKIIKRPGNKVDIVFEIDEGSKTTVKKIIFIGNKNFSDDDLKDVMTTKEEKLWRFWDYDSHVYREDKIDVDVDAITSFYKNNGYPFFMVTSTSAEMDPDKTSYYCTFTMDEGDKYTISSASLESEVKNINPADFVELIQIQKDDIYNEEKITKDRNEIRKEVSLQDHPFVDVIVNTDYDKKNKTAAIKYVIVERPKAFLERIEIVGNTRTLDNVIRREFSIHEGDALNVYKIQSAVERLKGIGYFDDVELTELDGSADDKKVLLVNVKEKESTAQFKFGFNLNDADGFGGMIGFSENNLMGTGRTLSAEALWMQRYYGAKINLYDPRFMDQNFGAGVTIGASSYDRKKVDQSITRSIFITPYVRYAISDHVYHIIRYTLSRNQRRWWSKDNNRAFDTVPDSVKDTVLMRDEYGKYTSGEIGSTLIYDRTDNEFNPRDGYELSMTNSYAGIIGNVQYFKNELGAKYYHPITEKVTFIIDANIGHIHEIKGTRSAHRFALGGDILRGFESGGVGPKDAKDNSIGGNKYWTVSFLAKVPLSTKEMGINGVVFVDFGSAWGVKKYSKENIRDSSGIRASTGVAIEWAKSPLGMPMSFIFGFPFKKKSFDEKQTFTLSGFM